MSLPKAYTVLIADDEAPARDRLARLVGELPEWTVVGSCATGSDALRLVGAHAPAVVLMDIRMPGMDGIEATRRIAAAGSETRVLVLTTFDLDEYVLGALRAGASGFLLKDTLPEELIAAVRVVAGGEALLAPSVTRLLIEQFTAGAEPAAPAAPPPGLDTLTEREVEVLAAVARGLSNREIADELFMAHATAKTHVSRLLTKLDCRDRAQLVMIAYEVGIAVPGEVTRTGDEA
jgi:DNA-binding NarL/FixJ family response regulator